MAKWKRVKIESTDSYLYFCGDYTIEKEGNRFCLMDYFGIMGYYNKLNEAMNAI